MARKKRKESPAVAVDLSGIRGALYHAPPSTQLAYGIGAFVLGWAALRLMPKTAETLIPAMASMFLPPPAASPHPEAAEPVRTFLDERQLGRSEVVRAIARGGQN